MFEPGGESVRCQNLHEPLLSPCMLFRRFSFLGGNRTSKSIGRRARTIHRKNAPTSINRFQSQRILLRYPFEESPSIFNRRLSSLEIALQHSQSRPLLGQFNPLTLRSIPKPQIAAMRIDPSIESDEVIFLRRIWDQRFSRIVFRERN